MEVHVEVALASLTPTVPLRVRCRRAALPGASERGAYCRATCIGRRVRMKGIDALAVLLRAA
jgi:hypothetical protein